MLLFAGTFRSTLNGGGGGLEFYMNNRFARSSPVFNNFLNTFVPDCWFVRNRSENTLGALKMCMTVLKICITCKQKCDRNVCELWIVEWALFCLQS